MERRWAKIRKVFVLIPLVIAVVLAGCGGGGGGTALSIAYIYDSVDSPACASIDSVLGDYTITRIPHNTVEITSASLNPYALIIIADQGNPHEYSGTVLASAIADAGKPILAMGGAASYFYTSKVFAIDLPGLSYSGSGAGLTQITPVAQSTNPVWTTPNPIIGSPVMVFESGHYYYGVTKANWPGGFDTGGVSVGTTGSSNPTFHVLAREADLYFYWGLRGSLDDLNDTGKAIFENAVHYMLDD